MKKQANNTKNRRARPPRAAAASAGRSIEAAPKTSDHTLPRRRILTGSFRATFDGRILQCNQAFARIFGFRSPAEARKHPAGNLYWNPAERAELIEFLKRRRTAASLEVQGRRKDGTPVWLLMNAALVATPEGPVVQATLTDVTERKRTEEALRDSEMAFRELAESIGDVFFAMDRDLKYTYWNNASEALTGIPARDALGKSLYDLFPDIKGTPQERLYLQVLTTRRPGIVAAKYQIGGQARFFEISAYPSRRGLSVFAADITERKRAEEALRESEERFRGIVENAPFGYYRVGKDGLWQYVNATWERMHGLSREQVVGRSFEITQPKDSVEQATEYVERALAGEAITGEFGRVRADGTIGHHSFNIQPVKLGEEILAIEGFISDITERKKAEEALLRQRRQLHVLSEASQQINDVLEIPAIMRTLIASALQLTEAEAGTAGLVVGGKMVFREYDRSDELPAAIDYTFEPGYGVPGWVLQTRKPYVTNDPEHDPHVVPEIRKALGFSSLAVVPIIDRHGEVMGCLWIHNKSEGRPFDKHDVDMLQGLAAAAAVALENAQMLTERKRTEEALRREHSLLSSVLDTSPIGIIFRNRQGQVTFANRGAERVLGLERSGILARTYNDPAWRITDHDGAPVPEQELPFARVMTSGQSVYGFRSAMEWPDGQRRLLSTSAAPLLDAAGQPDGMVAAVEDVTETIRIQQALQESEQRYRTLFESVNVPILVFRPDDEVILEANTSACAVYGFPKEELIGMSLERLTKDVARGKEHLKELMRCGHYSNYQSVHFDRSGNVMEMLVSGSVIEFRGAKAVLSVNRDISEMKEAERKLRQLSGRLLQVQDQERRRIARDLHDQTAQNLSAVAMNLSLLLEEPGEQDAPKLLFDSLRLARRALEEVRSVSYLLHPPLLDELGLAEALGIYATGFTQRTGIQVALRVPPDFPRLSSEMETTLFRIVQESLSNVHRHSGSPDAAISIRLADGLVFLEVQDQGCGLGRQGGAGGPGKPADLGVGIAGMRERARQLGGRLEVESGGRGVTVRAVLPVDQEEP